MDNKSLHELARLYSVQTAYEDVDRNVRNARPEVILAALEALGAPARTFDDVPSAVRERRQQIWQTPIKPVTVAWDGMPAVVELRTPAASGSKHIRWELETTNYDRGIGNPEPDQATGSVVSAGHVRLDELETIRQKTVEGVLYEVKRLVLPEGVPLGYHRLHVEVGQAIADGMVMVAPSRACGQEVLDEPSWGVFLPLYSLHHIGAAGGQCPPYYASGDLGSLCELVRWSAALGSKAVGMLPLLATLWELGDGPSPYEPTSRLFWNEFYLDVNGLPNVSGGAPIADSPVGRALPAGGDAMRKASLVDFARQMAAKRQIVSAAAEGYFAGDDKSELDSYCRRQPLAEVFARFRAAGQHIGEHWLRWPERMRQGDIQPGDYDQRDYRYYLYSQWQMQEQLGTLANEARTAGAMLYMDFPLGVRGDGFDAWLERDLFVRGMEVGAPPDPFSRTGQNWRFPPIHPHKQRQTGYRYFVSCLRQHLEHSRIIRLDHVMSLHRLYWVPHGMEAADGVYVRYPIGEMLAILTLESHRHRAMIVGENLGTVPQIVNHAMRRRSIHSMYVVPFEVAPGHSAGLKPIPADCVASMNTHDMPPWAAYWDGLDIDEQMRLGQVSPDQAQAMREDRSAARKAITSHLRRCGLLNSDHANAAESLHACLSLLGASAARLVMVNLEDMWGETLRQNLPSAPEGYPNWRRKARYPMEEFTQMPQVASTLERLDQARRQRSFASFTKTRMDHKRLL